MTTSPDRERGAVTLMLVVLIGALFAISGLTYDGGRILAARREALDVANAAARAGAQHLDYGALRAGRTTLDPIAATAAAHQFLTDAGYTGTVTITSAGDLRVTVVITRDLALLSIIGINERTVTGVGTARPVRGVTQGDQ